MKALQAFFGRNSDIALVLMVLGVLIVLFAPIPKALLDFLILANFSFAFLILLLNGLLGTRRIPCPCALLLRDGARDGRQHERSDDRRSFH